MGIIVAFFEKMKISLNEVSKQLGIKGRANCAVGKLFPAWIAILIIEIVLKIL